MIDFDDIILGSEAEAEAVRDRLRKLLEQYGQVSVGDYLNLVGLSSTFSDEKMGWTQLSTILIKNVNSGFTLQLPEPKQLGQQRTSTDREELVSRLMKSAEALEGMIMAEMMTATANEIDPYQMRRPDGTPVLAPLVVLQASCAMTLAALGGR